MAKRRNRAIYESKGRSDRDDSTSRDGIAAQDQTEMDACALRGIRTVPTVLENADRSSISRPVDGRLLMSTGYRIGMQEGIQSGTMVSRGGIRECNDGVLVTLMSLDCHSRRPTALLIYTKLSVGPSAMDMET